MATTTLMALALMAGCNSQSKVDPADATPEPPAPAEPAPIQATLTTGIPERGDDAERASKNGQLEHQVGDVKVDVRFGRPEMRGRDIFGSLVAYGEVWRTGADEATVVAIDHDVLVQGQKLPEGVYSLFTVPGETEWTVIFNGTPKQWGAYKYDEGADVLRVTATPEAAETTEAFDIQGTDDGIVLRWADVAVPITIAAAPAEGSED